MPDEADAKKIFTASGQLEETTGKSLYPEGLEIP